MFSCWPSTTSFDGLRPELLFLSTLYFILHPLQGARYMRDTAFRLDRRRLGPSRQRTLTATPCLKRPSKLPTPLVVSAGAQIIPVKT
jgi:hypothetical protein